MFIVDFFLLSFFFFQASHRLLVIKCNIGSENTLTIWDCFKKPATIYKLVLDFRNNFKSSKSYYISECLPDNSLCVFYTAKRAEMFLDPVNAYCMLKMKHTIDNEF